MKRKVNLFLHGIREIKRNKKVVYKIRFLILAIIFLVILSVGVFSIVRSFSFYNSKASLSLDIQTAMYVIEPGEMSFNIDLDKIVPSEDSYIYTFSISNFDDTKRTDVDLEYYLKIQTTTNLPLSYSLYYDCYDISSPNIVSSSKLKQDEDDSWYYLLTIDTRYEFSYTENQTNIYYLVIDFPTAYKDILEYSDAIENIQVIIESKQII